MDATYMATRFSETFYDDIHHILCSEGTSEGTSGLFQIAKQQGRVLFVHAGITAGWYDRHVSKLMRHKGNLADQLNSYFQVNKDAFYEIHRNRVGFHNHGSPLWADFNEFVDEEEIFDDQILQIVGHSLFDAEEPIKLRNKVFCDNKKLHLFENM